MKSGFNLLMFFLALLSSAVEADMISQTVTDSEVAPRVSNTKLMLYPSYGLLNSMSGYGGGLDLLFSGLLPGLYVGFETGYEHWSVSSAYGPSSVSSIPILPTMTYQFDLPQSSTKAYIGTAMGVSITPTSSTVAIDGVTLYSQSSTAMNFEWLVKPGVLFSNSFFVEPKFGILNNSFIFLPSVGMNFDI